MEKWTGSEGGSGQELRSPKPRISPQRRYLSNSGSAGCSQRLREANFIGIMRSQLSRTAVHSLDSSSAWEQHRSGSHPLLIPVVVHSHHLAPARWLRRSSSAARGGPQDQPAGAAGGLLQKALDAILRDHYHSRACGNCVGEVFRIQAERLAGLHPINTRHGNRSRVLPGIHIRTEKAGFPPTWEPARLRGSGPAQNRK